MVWCFEIGRLQSIGLLFLFCIFATPFCGADSGAAKEGGKVAKCCLSEMENAVADDKERLRSEYVALLSTATAADDAEIDQKGTIEAFLGKLFSEWRESHCGNTTTTSISPVSKLHFDDRYSVSAEIAAVSVQKGVSFRSCSSTVVGSSSAEAEFGAALGSKGANLGSRSVEVYGSPSSEECSALADLYDATGGPKWHVRTGWEDRTALLSDCCRAYGVKCDSDSQHVLHLKLMSNNLHGTIPSSIRLLGQISTL